MYIHSKHKIDDDHNYIHWDNNKDIFSAFYSMNGLVLILRDEHGKTWYKSYDAATFGTSLVSSYILGLYDISDNNQCSEGCNFCLS